MLSWEKPLVKPMAPGSILYHISFRSIILFYYLFYFAIFTFQSIQQTYQKYLSYYLYQISLLQVAVKGLTTPLLRWFPLEEERVMQQSSVSISLSFWEPRYQSSRRLHASRLVLAQTIKNLATNAIKGLSILSRPLAKVRYDKDNEINIFGIFVV